MWLQALAGEKWTPEQLDQWQAEERALAVSRKRVGEIARKELGVEVVNLFVSTELAVPPTGASQSANNNRPRRAGSAPERSPSHVHTWTTGCAFSKWSNQSYVV